MKSSHFRGIILVALLALGTAVYYPGLNGPFLFDDTGNFLMINAVKVQELTLSALRDAAMSEDNLLPTRGLARLTFALNYYFAGDFNEFHFKTFNVIVHLLNGLLVWWLSTLLVRRYVAARSQETASFGAYLPLFVAAIWLLHPIQLTAVLYVVQRMTSMAATCVFLGLIVFVYGRMRIAEGRRSGLWLMLLGLGGGAAVGLLCKQNALLIPFFAFLIELFFFDRNDLREGAKKDLNLFYGATVLLPVIVGLVVLFVKPEIVMNAYEFRTFTFYERVLTEGRVLFFYLFILAMPQVHRFGLYHDDFLVSTGLMDPGTTLIAVLGWITLIVVALLGIRRRSMFAFAVLWYLVGHSMESTIISLELIFEHRNYVPSFGVIFGLSVVVAAFFARWPKLVRVGPLLALLTLGVLTFSTFIRASIWADRETLFAVALEHHPNSSRTHGEVAISLRDQMNWRESFHHWQQAARLSPSYVLCLVEMNNILVASIDARKAEGEVAEGEGSEPNIFETPIDSDLATLVRLEVAIAKEVSERLKTQPIEPTTVLILRNMQDCITSGGTVCQQWLYRIERWVEYALANPRGSNKGRGHLLITLAKLQAYQGKTEEAIATVKKSISMTTEVQHHFELVTLYLTVGRIDDAEKALDELQAGHRHLDYRSFEIDIMRRRIEEARQTVKDV